MNSPRLMSPRTRMRPPTSMTVRLTTPINSVDARPILACAIMVMPDLIEELIGSLRKFLGLPLLTVESLDHPNASERLCQPASHFRIDPIAFAIHGTHFAECDTDDDAEDCP